MFSCVWLHFKKISEKYFLVFGKEEGKDNPNKTRTKPRKNPDKKSSTIDARLGSTARCFASSSPTTAPSIAPSSDWTARSHEGEIAIDVARSRSTARSREGEKIAIDVTRSRSTARSREASITISQSTAPIAIGAMLREIAVVELELARSARTGARGSPAIVGLDWSSVINDHALSLSFSLFSEIL